MSNTPDDITRKAEARMRERIEWHGGEALHDTGDVLAVLAELAGLRATIATLTRERDHWEAEHMREGMLHAVTREKLDTVRGDLIATERRLRVFVERMMLERDGARAELADVRVIGASAAAERDRLRAALATMREALERIAERRGCPAKQCDCRAWVIDEIARSALSAAETTGKEGGE